MVKTEKLGSVIAVTSNERGNIEIDSLSDDGSTVTVVELGKLAALELARELVMKAVCTK